MTSHQPILLGLTGGIACGKSEAGRILSEAGLAVLDTDQLAHELMKAGSPVYLAVVDCFGSSVVGDDGEIDRKMLGNVVFHEPRKLEKLNELVHPAVIIAAKQWAEKQVSDAAILVPLLFESGWTDGWDAVICICADESMVFQRLEKRGLSRAEARRRIAAQMPLEEKKKKSDFVIQNNDTLNALREETLAVLARVQQMRNPYE